MITSFNENLAKLAINYAANVEEGERIFISSPAFAKSFKSYCRWEGNL